jgi:hypothetical protein
MHSDMLKAIQLIDQRIAALQEIRNKLAQEFGFESTQSPLLALPSGIRHPQASPNSNGHGRVTRKDQIVQFIREHGPAARSEIIAGTQMPAGTVAACLNDKDTFVNRGGKWVLTGNDDGQ